MANIYTIMWNDIRDASKAFSKEENYFGGKKVVTRTHNKCYLCNGLMKRMNLIYINKGFNMIVQLHIMWDTKTENSFSFKWI